MSTPFGIIGRGWAFPPAFRRSSLSVDMLTDVQDINSSLHILFNTLQGERVMQVKYGCDLKVLLFEPLTTTLKTFITDNIKTAILYYEPRIDVDKVTINDEGGLEGKITIIVEYIVRTTNSRYNYVFDYFNEATEIENLNP